MVSGRSVVNSKLSRVEVESGKSLMCRSSVLVTLRNSSKSFLKMSPTVASVVSMMMGSDVSDSGEVKGLGELTLG